MNASARLAAYINTHPDAIGKVVDFNPANDWLYIFDLTAANLELDHETIWDTEKFASWISAKLKTTHSRYGAGGFMEHRTLYARSPLFDTGAEPRRLHLGIDIWAEAGTPIYCPIDGIVHSFQDNNYLGDYGPTIIMQHNLLDGSVLYSLYGHLSRNSLDGLSVGKPISKDQKIGELGNMDQNGHWPPHLHFQLMYDLEGKNGDYPGVGQFSEKLNYLQNIADPNLVLRFPKL